MRFTRPTLIFILALALLPAAGFAGGAWVAAPGDGNIQLGYSRKHAASSFNAVGDHVPNGSQHDFRYAYLSGDVGLLRNLSGQFLLTWLDGYEGPPGDRERNTGFSDAWFGLKYQVHGGRLPMAVGASIRTPMLYDREGPYSRYTYDSTGEISGLSDEWRGLLKYDYTLAYYVSRDFAGGKGWANLAAGYTWRAGAPADQFPVSLDGGYGLPWLGMAVKGELVYVRSRSNTSPREPDDRFGGTVGFNQASMGRVGLGILVPIGPGGFWNAEVGYNKWIWGRSARRYQEPYFSIGRRF
jgi:hypothetical protein